MTENHKILQSNHPLIKNKKEKPKLVNKRLEVFRGIKNKQAASPRQPVWEKYMKIDFMNRRVSQPGDRKKEERKENLHNILML